MAFSQQTFVERGVGGGGLTSTADAVLYIRSEDRAKLAAAWALGKPAVVAALDTEGKPAVVLFSNDPSKRIDYKGLLSDRMVAEALKKSRSKTLYTVSTQPGQRPNCVDGTAGVAISMVCPYADPRDVVPKFLSSGDSIHEGYSPLALYSSPGEMAAMSIVDAPSGDARDAIGARDAGKTADQLVGDEFTRSYDAPGVDPSMYWIGEEY